MARAAGSFLFLIFFSIFLLIQRGIWRALLAYVSAGMLSQDQVLRLSLLALLVLYWYTSTHTDAAATRSPVALRGVRSAVSLAC